MYVVLLHHTAPLQEVGFCLVEHSEWINKHYQSGDFIASGRVHPRSGCMVILARTMSRGRLDAILAAGPLVLRDLARTEVIEFQALRIVRELSSTSPRRAES
jgi:uncharacterized protein YciI